MLTWLMPGHVELDRVLGRHDVLLHGVEGGDGRVERVRLAASGRPGDQDDAPRPGDGLLEGLERFGLEAELGQVDLEHSPGRGCRATIFSPKIVGRDETRMSTSFLPVLLELDPHLDPAVLGQALLGDVHVGHDLDPGQHRVLELHRQVHGLVEDAVDAVADAEGLLVGLEVDVARALLDGLDEDVVDEGDDRGLVRDSSWSVSVELVLLLLLDDR